MAVLTFMPGKEFADMGVQNRRQEHKACITAANFRTAWGRRAANARSLYSPATAPDGRPNASRAFEFDGEVERFVWTGEETGVTGSGRWA